MVYLKILKLALVIIPIIYAGLLINRFLKNKTKTLTEITKIKKFSKSVFNECFKVCKNYLISWKKHILIRLPVFYVCSVAVFYDNLQREANVTFGIFIFELIMYLFFAELVFKGTELIIHIFSDGKLMETENKDY